MNLFLFLITIIISFVVVRVGAIAFQLTGLEWSLAKFQALSCFSGTGFTTKEAELITSHPQRRNIATVLMILGNAGIVTLIATFANSLRSDTFAEQFTIPFIKAVVPANLVPWVNLLVIVISIYLIYRIFTGTRFANRITSLLRKQVIKKDIIKKVSFEELMLSTGGYGVAQIEIREGNPLLNKRIIETGLRKKDISILVVERKGQAIPNPSADTTIRLGDNLVCFGKLDEIRSKIA